MTDQKSFSFKELVYLLPGLFGLFLVCVILFPLFLVLGFLAQEFGPGPVALVLAGLAHLTLAAIGLHRLIQGHWSRSATLGLALLVLGLPVVGPALFLTLREPRYPRPLE